MYRKAQCKTIWLSAGRGVPIGRSSRHVGDKTSSDGCTTYVKRCTHSHSQAYLAHSALLQVPSGSKCFTNDCDPQGFGDLAVYRVIESRHTGRDTFNVKGAVTSTEQGSIYDFLSGRSSSESTRAKP